MKLRSAHGALALAALVLAACPSSSAKPAAPEAPGAPMMPAPPPPMTEAGDSADGFEPATVEMAEGKLVPSRAITFESGSDVFDGGAEGVLDAVRAFLDDKTYITVLRIEVHSDAMGNTEANQALTEARAREIARWLVAHGIDCSRVLPVGFGETKPVADNQTGEGRAANRRVELVPAELRGKAIGGMPLDGGGMVAGDPCRN